MKIQSAKAGIGTGRAGLQAASGLFSNAGLFDKGVKSFNPLDLDPYLLFDAQTSMIGTLENPTLDLDPSKQDTLDIITATRAGTATFTDANGLIATAPSDTVRVDHVDGVPMILVEPSAINRTKTSENFNSSEWTQLGNGQGSAPIVTDNYAYSPDGTQNATRLQVSLNGGNTVTDQSIIYDIDNSNTVQTISVWMKSNTNDAYDIYLANTHIGNGTDIAQVTPQWQRFSFSHTTSNHTFSLGLRGGIGASDSADILIWGAQGEAGSVSTSYIPTSGSAVTRAADDLVISGSDFDFYNQSEGTIYVESTGRGYFDFNTMFAFSDNSASNRIYARSTSNSGGLAVFSGGSTSASMGGLTVVANNVLSRSAHSFKANNFLSSRDGISATPDTSGNMPVGIDRLYIGAAQTGGNQLNGHLKRLIYWPYHSDSL